MFTGQPPAPHRRTPAHAQCPRQQPAASPGAAVLGCSTPFFTGPARCSSPPEPKPLSLAGRRSVIVPLQESSLRGPGGGRQSEVESRVLAGHRPVLAGQAGSNIFTGRAQVAANHYGQPTAAPTSLRLFSAAIFWRSSSVSSAAAALGTSTTAAGFPVKAPWRPWVKASTCQGYHNVTWPEERARQPAGPCPLPCCCARAAAARRPPCWRSPRTVIWATRLSARQL